MLGELVDVSAGVGIALLPLLVIALPGVLAAARRARRAARGGGGGAGAAAPARPPASSPQALRAAAHALTTCSARCCG